jgi:uridylate kinase
MNEEINIISVGGSLIVPNEINLIFLDKFRNFILQETEKGRRFVIIAGGGWTAREYQNAAKNMGKPTDFDLDMLGIHATRINAFLLKTVLSDLAHPEIILNPSDKIDFEEKVLIAAEENPGAEATSDYGAVKIAEYIGTKTIINLTNVNYVFDKNPKDYPDAKPIRKMNWERFFEILPKDWNSGDHAPFGPKAAKEAREKGVDVVIIGGGNLGELSKFLDGEKFEGTLISDKTN